MEAFAYPGAAQILAQQHVTLKSGDGNIQIADCTSPGNLVQVYSRTLDPGPVKVCFRVTGPTGYLALELPKVYGITGDDHTVKATLSTDGSVSSANITKNYYTPVGEGASTDGTTLLELTATDGPAATGTTNAYPAVAAIAVGQPGRAGSRACTGTLVDTYWLLTAASCFATDPATGFTVPAGAPALATTVTIGRADLATSGGHTVAVAELVPRTDRDLVMARLATPVTDVTPLAVATTAPVQGETLRLAGYGRTQTEWVPNKLHTATFNVDAVKTTGIDITGVSPAGSSVCQGDTGGPTLRESGGTAKLAAVASTSWQNGCLGSTETTHNGANSTRVDDIAEWVQRTASSTPSGTTVAGSPFTIVDPVDHHIVTYLRDSNSHLWSVDPQGEGWKNFGAYAAADPFAMVNPADQHVIVYVNGPNNQLWSLDERGNGWTQFPTTLSNTALAPNAVPHTVVDPADGHLVTYIRDTASHLWSVDPQDEGWADFGPMAATDPTAIANPANGHVVVYVNGPNNRLNSVDQRGSGWTQFPTTLSNTALAPNAVPHTVVDPADGHLVTYIRDTASHLWSVDPQGEGWVDFGPMAATDPTTIANPANTHLITYVNGPNNRLNMVDPLGPGWTEFTKTPDGTVLAGDAVPQTIVDPADGHLVTVVRDTRNALWAVDPQGEGWTKYHGGPSGP